VCKPIPEFPHYIISKDGIVWSNKKRKQRLNPSINKDGYCYLTLRGGERKYYRTIHRLVLETFIGPRPQKMQCRHLNGNRTDNRLENLRWGTSKENEADKRRHKTHSSLKGGINPMSKLSEFQVRAIIYLHKIARYSQTKLAKVFNISQPNVNMICTGKTWSHLNII
jgi:hypothetical protein